MVLQLDPRLPLVWRSPTSLQLGVDDPAVVLANVSADDERMLAALIRGITDSGFQMLAREIGASVGAATALLKAVGPALRASTSSTSTSDGTQRRSRSGRAGPAESRPAECGGVTIVGTGHTVDRLADALGSVGVVPRRVDCDPVAAVEGTGLAVVVAHYVIDPAFHGLWLRRDRPHLPIVFSDTGVRIGPIVEPGTGPCLYCLERWRTDTDSAWPAIASQLWGKRSDVDTGIVAAEVATVATRMLLERLQRGHPGEPIAIRLTAASGARVANRVEPHPDCACGALPGNATADGQRISSPRTRHRTGEARAEPG